MFSLLSVDFYKLKSQDCFQSYFLFCCERIDFINGWTLIATTPVIREVSPIRLLATMAMVHPEV